MSDLQSLIQYVTDEHSQSPSKIADLDKEESLDFEDHRTSKMSVKQYKAYTKMKEIQFIKESQLGFITWLGKPQSPKLSNLF